MTKKVVVEIELPEDVSLDQILRGVKYRVVEDPVAELEEILRSASRKRARIDRIPTREEIYADRARH